MAKLLKRRTAASVRMILFPAESPSTGICYSTPMFVCPGFETGLVILLEERPNDILHAVSKVSGCCSMQVQSSFVFVVSV